MYQKPDQVIFLEKFFEIWKILNPRCLPISFESYSDIGFAKAFCSDSVARSLVPDVSTSTHTVLSVPQKDPFYCSGPHSTHAQNIYAHNVEKSTNLLTHSTHPNDILGYSPP